VEDLLATGHRIRFEILYNSNTKEDKKIRSNYGGSNLWRITFKKSLELKRYRDE